MIRRTMLFRVFTALLVFLGFVLTGSEGATAQVPPRFPTTLSGASRAIPGSICATCEGGGGWTWDDCLNYPAAPNSAIVATFSGGYTLNCGAVRHIAASGHAPSKNMIPCISRTLSKGRLGSASDPQYRAITWLSVTTALSSYVVFNAANKTIVTAYTAPDRLWTVCVSS